MDDDRHTTIELFLDRQSDVLGEQFDVMGYKGWNLCNSDTERRALIKRAIELHRYKGTKWAVQEALKSIGFEDIKITEHVNGHWARFSLDVDNETVVIDSAGFTKIIAMVEEYKNVRSVLDSVNIRITVNEDAIVFADNDSGSVEDEIEETDTIVFSGGLYYDGTENYDGSNDHSGDADIAEII